MPVISDNDIATGKARAARYAVELAAHDAENAAELHPVSVDMTLSKQEPRGAALMDENIIGMDVAVGAVGSEVERRSSVLSTAQNDGAVAALAPGQRWSLSRKREVVLRLMQGEPVEALSRRLGLPVYKLEEWRQRGLAGTDAGLRERDDDAKER